MSECILSGRQGPKGDTGPRGATGATGATGPAGPAGAAGASFKVATVEMVANGTTTFYYLTTPTPTYIGFIYNIENEIGKNCAGGMWLPDRWFKRDVSDGTSYFNYNSGSAPNIVTVTKDGYGSVSPVSAGTYTFRVIYC